MNLTIDLRQLRYFLAVSDALHFGRAAQQLHISQPPLSRQIRQLEEALGVALFHRNKMAVSLTEAGVAFLPEVRRTLAQAERAVAAARAARGTPGGNFLVGYTTVFDQAAIPDVFEPMRLRFPDWRFTTRGKHSISLVRDVKNGAMDAAFIGLHTEASGLVVETVLEEPLCVALPAQYGLARRRKLGFDDLRGVPMFWFERRLNPGFHDHCQAFFERIGFKPTLMPEPADHHITLGLIAQGQGVALIPQSMRNLKRQGVVFRPLKETKGEGRLTMGIAVAYLARNETPVLREFLTLLRWQAAGFEAFY